MNHKNKVGLLILVWGIMSLIISNGWGGFTYYQWLISFILGNVFILLTAIFGELIKINFVLNKSKEVGK